MTHFGVMAFEFLERLVTRQQEGKALLPNRFFDSNAPLTTYSPGGQQRKRGLITQREAQHHAQAYGGSEAIDWVMDAVDLYTDTVASAHYHFEKKGKKLWEERTDDTPDDGELADPILVELLKQPNPFQDYDELITYLVQDLLLVGNAYWYKFRMFENGKPLAIYRLSPSDIKAEPGPQGIEKYVYAPRGTDKKLEITPAEIIHFKRPNPHNNYFGIGIIKGGGRPLDLELALTDSQAYYFENKAEPSMIVQSERRVPRDVFNKMRAQLRARAAGAPNAGELLVLEAGLKATSLTPSASDAMYADLSDKSADRILAMFRVSRKQLGYSESGSAGDKVQDAQRQFDNKTMRPFLDRLQRKVSNELTRPWDVDFKIDYGYVIPQEELVKLAGEFATLPGIKVKEIRAFLASIGITESTGDKEIDEMVLNLPGEELGPDGQPVAGGAGFADRPLPGEPGRPPKGESTRAFPKGTAARQPKGQKSVKEVLARLDELDGKAVKFEEPERATIGTRLPDEQIPEDALLSERTRDVDSIVAESRRGILDAMHVLERGLLDHVEGKAFDPTSLTKRIRNSNSWKSFMSMLTTVLERSAQQSLSAAAVHQGTQDRLPEDEIDYEAVARGIVHRKNGVRSITQNLKDDIVQKVAEAVKQGKDREAVDQIIRESVRYWQETKAETVALTEAVEAYNEGTLVVLEALGHDNVVVLDGEDFDDACKEANGAIWPIDHARDNRLEHPRCRRAFTALPTVA